MNIFSISTILALATLQAVKADYLYNFVVYANNTPAGALDAIEDDADAILATFFEVKPAYEPLKAGESISTYSTNTYSSTTTNNNSNRDLAEGEDKTALRGAQRELQAGSQCPASCKWSNSQYCRNINCAMWGNGRRLRKDADRDLTESGTALSYTEKVYIESNINKDLSSYCNGAPNCKIWLKILKVNADGSTTSSFTN